MATYRLRVGLAPLLTRGYSHHAQATNPAQVGDAIADCAESLLATLERQGEEEAPWYRVWAEIRARATQAGSEFDIVDEAFEAKGGLTGVVDALEALAERAEDAAEAFERLWADG